MPTFAKQTPAFLAQNITNTLARLRDERRDGEPGHTPERCTAQVCAICAAERALDRLLQRVGRV